MQRRELVRILKAAGFISKGGTNHEKFYKGGKTVLVKRHREIEDQIAKRILREAGLRQPLLPTLSLHLKGENHVIYLRV